jgi:hypothetical protein
MVRLWSILFKFFVCRRTLVCPTWGSRNFWYAMISGYAIALREIRVSI